nr:hypothetical protein [Tanacetum cinerariifolium]
VRKLHAELNEDIDWDVAIDHVKLKAKKDPAVQRFTAASVIIFAAEPQVPAVTITAAPTKVAATPSRRRKRVVIRDLKEESTTSSIIPVDT